MRPSLQTLVGILQQQIQSNHEALSSVHAAAESGEEDEKVKGEEMEEEEEEDRPRSAPPSSSPPPLTSLLDSETGKMLPVQQDGGLNGLQAHCDQKGGTTHNEMQAAAKKSSLEEAVERMKAATSDGVKSPEEVTEEQ